METDAFFCVISSHDIWSELKKYMFFNKKVTNIYNYQSGDAAAANGYLQIIKFNKNIKNEPHMIDFAAHNGRLEVVKFLLNRNEKFTIFAMSGAAKNGHLEIVKLLYYTKKEYCNTKYATKIAIENGQTEIVYWLNSNTGGCKPKKKCSVSIDNKIKIQKNGKIKKYKN